MILFAFIKPGMRKFIMVGIYYGIIYLFKLMWEGYKSSYTFFGFSTRIPPIVLQRRAMMESAGSGVKSVDSIGNDHLAVSIFNAVRVIFGSLFDYMKLIIHSNYSAWHEVLTFYMLWIVKYQLWIVQGYFYLFVIYLATEMVSEGIALVRLKRIVVFGTPILFYLMMFLGLYVFSIGFREWRSIGNSAERMSMFVVPITIYISAKIFVYLIKQKDYA